MVQKLAGICSLVLAMAMAMAAPIQAQEAQPETETPTGPTKYPETGLPILNCAPVAPAPQDTCVVRILPGSERRGLRSEPLGEVRGRFEMVRPNVDGFPDDLDMSATLILVDLSPGPGAGRRATFETERELIANLVRALPDDELVSVYGFNESFQRLSRFSKDHSDALEAVENLELQGSNTRIGTFVTDGLSVLADQDSVLLKNLILITDGQEEGSVDLSGVISQAVEEEIAISSIGMFWRPIGSAETSAGMDYVRSLSDGTSGTVAQAILRNVPAATESVAEFGDRYRSAILDSRLIVALDDPQPAEIFLTIGEEALGAPGELVENTISVNFIPAVLPVETPVAEEPEAEEESLIFGYPAMMVYGAAAGLAALLLLLVLLLALKPRRKDVEVVPEPIEGAEGFEPIPEPDNSPTVAVPTATAYLVFEDTQRRVGITGDKSNVGRSAANEVVVPVEGISRLHAQIFRNRDGGYSVTDMDSLNGTFVNGKKVKGSEKLRLGDTVRFGTVTAKLVSA